jgi:hypothetical protein
MSKQLFLLQEQRIHGRKTWQREVSDAISQKTPAQGGS